MPAKRKKPKPASASTKKSVRARAPRARYYSVTRTPDGAAVVLARHPLAKEAVWGWASGESRDRQSFYGTEDEPRASVPVDDRQYRWTLQPSAVDLLCRDIKRTINDPHYYHLIKRGFAQKLSYERHVGPVRGPASRIGYSLILTGELTPKGWKAAALASAQQPGGRR